MAYTSRRATSRSRARVNRSPARRTSRRAPVRRAAAGTRGRGPQVVKIVIEHSATAGAGMGGLDLPQIQTQTKKGRF